MKRQIRWRNPRLSDDEKGEVYYTLYIAQSFVARRRSYPYKYYNMLGKFEQYLTRVVTILLHFILVVALIRIFVIDPAVIDGQSMEDSLNDSDLCLVNKVVYLFRTPDRYEIVQFFNPSGADDLVVKRVVGLPGETIFFQRDSIYIQTRGGGRIELDQSYTKLDDLAGLLPDYQAEVVIPEHSYFVLGDNRFSSTDSRSFGPVHRRQITGKVVKL